MSSMADEDNVNCKIYVGSLNYDTNENGLRDFFEKVGPVVKTTVVYETDEKKKSRGFGFVTFEHPECVQKAIEEMNNKDLDGRTIKVDRAEKRKGGPQSMGGGFRGGRGRGRGGGFGVRGGFSDRRDDYRERRDYGYSDGYDRGYEQGRYRRDDYGSGDYYNRYDRYERYGSASGAPYGSGGYGRGGYSSGSYDNSYGRYDYRSGEGGYGNYRSGAYGREGYGSYSRESYY